MEIEQTIEEITKNIAKTKEAHNYLLNNIEILRCKNIVLNKRFKFEFPSKPLALTAYK